MKPHPAITPPAPDVSVLIRVDAHAHYHRCYDLPSFVQAAQRNLCADGVAECGAGRLGCLFLAGIGGSHPLLRIEAERARLPDGWTIRPTAESSLMLQYEGLDRIVLIAGRQVRTLERLELLTFGSRAPVVDGKPFGIALGHAVESSAMVIVPWALGKWRLGRETTVREALEAVRGRGAPVFLGDNANRFRHLKPRALSRLVGLTGGVLPGSDPIAHPGHVEQVGTFGFEIRCNLDPMTPAMSLFAALRQSTVITPFGSATSLATVVAGQIRVRVAAGAL